MRVGLFLVLAGCASSPPPQRHVAMARIEPPAVVPLDIGPPVEPNTDPHHIQLIIGEPLAIRMPVRVYDYFVENPYFWGQVACCPKEPTLVLRGRKAGSGTFAMFEANGEMTTYTVDVYDR